MKYLTAIFLFIFTPFAALAMIEQPFDAGAPVLQISAPSGSASSALQLPSQGSVLLLVNEGSSLCYIAIGSSSVTATVPGTSTAAAVTTSLPIPSGVVMTVSIPNDKQYYISAYGSGGTAKIDAAVGEGQ